MDISTDMLEDQVAEERDPDLNEEEDIRLDEIREEHLRDVADGFTVSMKQCDRKNNSVSSQTDVLN